MNDHVLVRMTGMTKSYPGVAALRGVDFELRSGEVHCLVGENGAGKSTLMRLLTGAEQPDQGVIVINGEEVTGLRPATAHRLGVSAIYQETDLVPELTVTQNMYLGHEKTSAGRLLDRRGMRAGAQAVLDDLKVTLSVDARISELSAANAQLVQIAKALTRDAKVLIMDEPSAVLSDHELGTLFQIMDDLRARGLGIIYISHRLDEVKHMGDRVTVMRDGQWVSTADVIDTSISQIIRAMVGRDVDDQYAKEPADRTSAPVALAVRNLAVEGHFREVSFELHRGEVLGIAGLVGAGRSALLNCVFGALPATSGEILVDGQAVRLKSPTDAIRHGIGLVPEDRRGAGLVLSRSVQDNVTLPSLDRLSRGGAVRRGAARSVAGQYVERLRIKTPSTHQLVRFLSGGNQQKVVIAKWLALGVSILLLDEPTVGVDVGAKSEIYALMNSLTEEGMSIVMVSSELPEVLGMSDRILVMSEGRITAELTPEQASQETIMEYAVPKSAAIA